MLRTEVSSWNPVSDEGPQPIDEDFCEFSLLTTFRMPGCFCFGAGRSGSGWVLYNPCCPADNVLRFVIGGFDHEDAGIVLKKSFCIASLSVGDVFFACAEYGAEMLPLWVIGYLPGVVVHGGD